MRDLNRNIGAIGTQWLNADMSFQASYNNFPTIVTEFLQALGAYKFVNPSYPSYPAEMSNEIVECDWVGGACLLVKRMH
jgi:GT2 family glycosyltransferase